MSENGWNLQKDIRDDDPEMAEIIKTEKERQTKSLEMIASNNFTSKGVIQALGSCLTNDGNPGQRHYKSNHIYMVERLCQKRALEAFGLDPEKWGVNVQVLSGSYANFAVYTAVAEPHGRIMGLYMPDGGHCSHGFMTASKKVSATSTFFESLPYNVDPISGLIDYDEVRLNARFVLPKLIIAGISCYSRNLDYKRFRDICNDVDAYLVADMAHVSGLVAAGVAPSPFDFCDIVTTTTYKTLRGPRSGIIFFRKGVRKVLKDGTKVRYNLEEKINETVYPGFQGGPHTHQIAAVAVALKQATRPEFKAYQQQVLANAKTMCKEMQARGYTIVSGGTDNHLILVDLRQNGLEGARAEKVLGEVGIYVTKKTRSGDKSTLNSSGLRIGTPALTSRNLKERDFIQVVDFIDRGIVYHSILPRLSKMSGRYGISNQVYNGGDHLFFTVV